MKVPISVSAQHIKPINVNGLVGRMVHIRNSNSNKVFVYVHGLHTSAERHYSLCQFLADFGEIYAPDLPGFGGMDSFYKIGITPSYDAYADYIYTFLKTINKSNKQIVLVGLSFGTQVITRMLQKYPQLETNIERIISIAGAGTRSDLRPNKLQQLYARPLFFLGSLRGISFVIKQLVFNPITLRLLLAIWSVTRPKIVNDKVNLKSDVIAMEYYLWRLDDLRTHAKTLHMIFSKDLRTYAKHKIKTKINNVVIDGDQWFYADKVDKSYRDLYENYESELLNFESHAPSLVVNKDGIADIFPPKTLKLLSQ